jgi:alpha-galactosidase
MRRVAHLGLLALLASLSLSAQVIQYDSARKIWLLSSPTSSYAMGLASDGQLQHLYWGGPLWRLEDVPPAVTHEDISSFDPHEMLDNEEYPGWGGKRYYETAFKITRANGNRDLVLRYASQSMEGNKLTIVLKDIKDDIEAELADDS